MFFTTDESMKLSKILIMSIVVITTPGFSWAIRIKKQTTLQTKVDEYIHAYVKMEQFSGSILIAKDGKILVNKGYGMANYELDVPNSPITKFRIASTTKQFTAMAIIQLWQKGLLNVNDPIIKYIPDYPKGNEITITHLLNHKSGIPDYTGFEELWEKMGMPITLEQLIESFKNKPLEFTPGEKYKYSNSNYALLTYIIEKVSGKPYETYLQENIFQPLAMNDSGYDHNATILKKRAAGYRVNDKAIANAMHSDMSWPSGAGGLYSTVEDLYKWDRALYTDKLVPKDTLDSIFGSLVKDPKRDDYAYGWVLDDWHGHTLMWHNGRISGFRSYIARYINDDVCIIVLSNYDFSPVEKIATDLARILFGMPYELPKESVAIKVDPSIYDAYVGQYELSPDFFLTIIKENDRLFVQPTGQRKLEFFPESKTKFFNKEVQAQISFITDETGNVTQLISHDGGMNQPAKKIK